MLEELNFAATCDIFVEENNNLLLSSFFIGLSTFDINVMPDAIRDLLLL